MLQLLSSFVPPQAFSLSVDQRAQTREAHKSEQGRAGNNENAQQHQQQPTTRRAARELSEWRPALTEIQPFALTTEVSASCHQKHMIQPFALHHRGQCQLSQEACDAALCAPPQRSVTALGTGSRQTPAVMGGMVLGWSWAGVCRSGAWGRGRSWRSSRKRWRRLRSPPAVSPRRSPSL